jgi:protein SCO1
LIQIKAKYGFRIHIFAILILSSSPHSPDPAISASKFAVPHRLVFMLCAMLVVAACNRSAQTTDRSGARHYEARGIVRGVAPDHRTIDVEHEAIPGFMPSMTMPFSLRDQKQIAGLAIGDAISFRLSVTDQDVWIDNVNKIDASEVRLPTPTPTPTVSSSPSARLREGDEMPSFTLTNQSRERVTLGNFRGQPLVLTFIFTRCPLPNFCPRMSHNFSELQTAIKSSGGTVAKTHLLSITLDPGFDTPEVLKSYGEYQNADPNIWTFATGQQAEIDALTRVFSVYTQTEGGTITHGLATALVAPDGKIDKIWRGNAWMPAEVVEAIRAESK